MAKVESDNKDIPDKMAVMFFNSIIINLGISVIILFVVWSNLI